MTGVDLPPIAEMDETTALIVLGEIGLDMRRWPREQHCTSWLGGCPRVRVSGGLLRSRTRPTAHRAATAHKLARLIYAMLKHGTASVAESMDTDEQTSRQRVVHTLRRSARDLGYDLVAKREAVTQAGLE